jgi:hypothetical protein
MHSITVYITKTSKSHKEKRDAYEAWQIKWHRTCRLAGVLQHALNPKPLNRREQKKKLFFPEKKFGTDRQQQGNSISSELIVNSKETRSVRN